MSPKVQRNTLKYLLTHPEAGLKVVSLGICGISVQMFQELGHNFCIVIVGKIKFRDFEFNCI